MATTPHLGVALVEQSQAQKEVTVNMALMRMDALLNTGAVSRSLAVPPAQPVAGEVYIVGAAASGAWLGQENAIAYFDQIWRFITPNDGVLLWVRDEATLVVFDSGTWSAAGGGGGGGEMNAAMNASGQAGGVFKDKNGSVLRFNNIVGGDGITVSGGGAGGGDITISAVGSLAGQSSVDNNDWDGDSLTVAHGGTGLSAVAEDCIMVGADSDSLRVTGVKIGSDNTLYGFRSQVQKQSGGAYSLTVQDAGKILECSHSAAFTLALPADLPVGFTCTVVQAGEGEVVFTAATGAQCLHRQGHNKTAGRYAACTVYVSGNAQGNNAIYILAGDTQG